MLKTMFSEVFTESEWMTVWYGRQLVGFVDVSSFIFIYTCRYIERARVGLSTTRWVDFHHAAMLQSLLLHAMLTCVCILMACLFGFLACMCVLETGTMSSPTAHRSYSTSALPTSPTIESRSCNARTKASSNTSSTEKIQ